MKDEDKGICTAYLYYFLDNSMTEVWRITFEDPQDIESRVKEEYPEFKTVEDLFDCEEEQLVTDNFIDVIDDFFDMFMFKQRCGEFLELKVYEVDLPDWDFTLVEDPENLERVMELDKDIRSAMRDAKGWHR